VATSFDTFAQDLKLNMTTFKACEADPAKFKAELQQDQTDATAAGVSGTPSFVIGLTSAKGIDGALVVGAQPYSVFDDKLKMLLASRP
jgi:predicted DsbA family dithiol-disulfide isomerase